jgi:uncharacterized protein YdaU (DUF1376 family)
VSNDEENAKPKRRPSWFRWNWDDFIAETDHLDGPEFTAATRLMGAMWRTEDCSLPFDPEKLERIVLGRSARERTRWWKWKNLDIPALMTVFIIEDGRISSPWLTKKRNETARAMDLKWTSGARLVDVCGTSATDKPLKNKTRTSPNREFRIQNSESKATTAAKARSMAKEKEASRGEQVKRPRSPEKSAEAKAKVLDYLEAKKRRAVALNLGISEGDIEQLTEDYKDEHEVDAGGHEDDASGTAA